jgi:hypothetical protein
MNNSERESQNNPEQFEHKTRASAEQLVLIHSQSQSLFDIAQTSGKDMFVGAVVTFDPTKNEAVYVLPPRQRRDSTREIRVSQNGPGLILEYRSIVDRLHAIRGMTLKADGLDSRSESAVYEEDHVGFFWKPEPVLLDSSHYEGVPQNYVDVAQEYLDELWASAKTVDGASLTTQ